MRAPRSGLALALFRVSRCSRNLDAGFGPCRWRATGAPAGLAGPGSDGCCAMMASFPHRPVAAAAGLSEAFSRTGGWASADRSRPKHLGE